MKITDRIKNLWNVPEEDDYDEYEEEKKSSYDTDYNFDYNNNYNLDEDFGDYEDEYEEEELPVNNTYQQPQRKERTQTSSTTNNANRVVNINATAKLQVRLFRPDSFGDDICEIADELIKMNTILLNLENAKDQEARRILDFLSGCAYSNKGSVKRIATSTYIVMPSNVHLSGAEIIEQLENSGEFF